VSEDIVYYPLTKGDQWVYVGGISGNLTDTITYKVAKRELLPKGNTAWKVARSWKEPTRSKTDTFYTGRVGEDVVVYLSKYDPDPDVILKFPLKVGKKWVSAKITADQNRESIVKGVESVTVPKGTFHECIVIESKDVMPDTVLRVIRDWYAPDVGRVKSVMEARSDVYEMQLLDYTSYRTQ
jgi:hypothetical protein